MVWKMKKTNKKQWSIPRYMDNMNNYNVITDSTILRKNETQKCEATTNNNCLGLPDHTTTLLLAALLAV